MNYYLIVKNNKTFKIAKKVKLAGGYTFNNKLSITLYNYGLVKYILNKKIQNSLVQIINLYLLYEDDEESSEREIVPRIETLRAILIEKYATFLTEGEIESYLTKLDKIENKILSKKSRKSRSL